MVSRKDEKMLVKDTNCMGIVPITLELLFKEVMM